MPYPEAIAHYPKSTQLLIKKFYNRVMHRNKNILAVVVGATGNGKSYDALGLMIGLDLYKNGKAGTPQEYMEHCDFRALNFINKMSDDLPRGNTWIWDEAGIDAGNQEYATNKNKVISWFAQTCRQQNQIILFTLPTLGMLTPQVRKLLHYYIEAVGVDEKNGIGIMKPLEMQYNTRMDKIYYHKLKVISQDGFVDSLELCGIPKQDQAIYDAYEEKKKEFRVDLYEDIKSVLAKIEGKRVDDKSLVDDRTDLENSMREAFNLGHKTLKAIAEYLGIDQKLLGKKNGFNILLRLKLEERAEKTKNSKNQDSIITPTPPA